MSIPVGNLVIEMAANVVRLQKDMDTAKRSVSGAMADIKKSADMAMSAIGAIGVGLSVNAFAGWIKGAIDAADSLNDLNKSTSIAVGELAGLKLAAKQSGGDLEGTAQAINKLSVNIANDVKKFASIGITAKDPLEAFKQLADIFSTIQDPQLRAALGAEALGKSWASAAPMLAEGGAKIGEMVEKGKQLSGITPEMVAASDAFNDTLAEMSTQVGGVATQIAAKLLPSLQTVADAMNEAGESTNSFSVAVEGVKTIFDTIIVLGANVGYVLKMTGLEISGLVEQLATIAGGGGLAAAVAIGDRMKADAIQARKDIDAFSEKILNGTKATTEAQDKATKSTANNTAAVEKNVRAFIDSNKEKKAGVDEYAKMIKSADDLVASIKFESDAYAMSNVEKETAIALQKLMNMGLKEGTAEYEKYTEAVIGAVIEKEQMKALADLKKKTEDENLKSIEKFNADRIKEEEKYADEVKSINEQIGQSLSDALMNGALNAGDFIKNMFKTMVLRPLLQPILTGVVGALTAGFAPSALAVGEGDTGGSVSSSMGLLGAASSAKSAYEVVSGGFTALGDSVTSFVAEMGMKLSTVGEAGGVLATSGEALLSSASSIGAVASYVGGVGAGLGLGNLISGGNSVGGSSWYTVGAGTAIGALVGGPLGAAIGGAIGGVINAAFGMGKKENTDSGILGNLTSSGVGLANYQEWEQKGGWLRSGDSGADWTPADSKVTKYMNNVVAATAISVKQYADILKLPAKGIADFSFEIKQSLVGLTAEEAQKQIDLLLAAYGNSLAATVTAEIGPFQRDGEEAGATLARLATSLQSVNSVFDTLNITLMETSLSGADASSKLIDMFGSVDKFVSATDAYYQAFYTEQERAAKTTEQLTNVFSQLGLSLPNTNAAFRAMVESARAAGNDGLFAALIKLAPTFNGLQQSIKSLNEANIQATAQALAAANSAVDAAFSAVQNAIQNELSASLAAIDQQKTIAEAARQVASESVDALKSIFDYLKSQVSDILATVNSAQTSAQGMSFVRNALVNAQNTGYLPDQALLSNAVSAARAGLSSENFATAFEMKRGNLLLAADLQQLQDIAGDQMSTAEQQLAVAEDQLSFLNAQAESTQRYYDNQLQLAQNQVNELRGVNVGVLSISSAMAALSDSISAQRTASAAAAAAASAVSNITNGNDLTSQVSQLYLEILGRAPDSGGLASWLSSGLSLDQIRAGIMNSDEKRLRGYASGGSYPGGLAMVGESGPELINFNRPGMVYNAAQTSSLLSGESVAGEVRALRTENQAQSRAIVQLQSRLTRVLERWDGAGMPSTRVEV